MQVHKQMRLLVCQTSLSYYISTQHNTRCLYYIGKNKGIQFNLQKRLTLSRLLSKESIAKEIGEILNMDSTSISREIKRNRVQTQEQRIEGSICFTCINKTNCCLKKQCGSLICGHRCVGCRSLKKM